MRKTMNTRCLVLWVSLVLIIYHANCLFNQQESHRLSISVAEDTILEAKPVYSTIGEIQPKALVVTQKGIMYLFNMNEPVPERIIQTSSTLSKDSRGIIDGTTYYNLLSNQRKWQKVELEKLKVTSYPSGNITLPERNNQGFMLLSQFILMHSTDGTLYLLVDTANNFQIIDSIPSHSSLLFQLNDKSFVLLSQDRTIITIYDIINNRIVLRKTIGPDKFSIYSPEVLVYNSELLVWTDEIRTIYTLNISDTSSLQTNGKVTINN
jgi:hypothetical protein